MLEKHNTALSKKSWMKCCILKTLMTAASTVYKLTRKVQTGEKEKAIFMQFYAKKVKTGLTLSKDRYSRRSRKI